MPFTDTRKARGLTQEKLAQKAGVSVRTIQRIERGLVRPQTDVKQRIARALGVSVADLFGG